MLIIKEHFNKCEISNLEIILEYQISAAFGVMKYWLQTWESLSESELIKILYKISTQSAFTILAKETNWKIRAIINS